MLTLKQTIKKRLLNAKRVAILGVGSDLRGDDAAGILIASQLNESLKINRNGLKFKVFIGSTAPENLTGEIKRFKPTHLIVLDSADTRKDPGAVSVIKPEETAGISFCTHQLPLKILLDYLFQGLGCQIIIIGIQPKKLDFGSQPSNEIKKSIKQVCLALKQILKAH